MELFLLLYTDPRKSQGFDKGSVLVYDLCDVCENGQSGFLKSLDRYGQIVYNRFKMKNKVDYKTLQRIGGNSSPNLLHLPGRCYSFEANKIMGRTELANAIKTSSVLCVIHNIEEG